jgi:hypothetical protein
MFYVYFANGLMQVLLGFLVVVIRIISQSFPHSLFSFFQTFGFDTKYGTIFFNPFLNPEKMDPVG